MNDTDGLQLPVGVTEQNALKQLARIEARALKVQRQAERGFVRANRTAARSFQGMSRSATGGLQNVSFQLQDIFVQVSSGQGLARSLGQQLPQLLSYYGALGAVLGLAASAAIPLASYLFDIGGAAETTEKQIKALSDAVKNLEQAQKLATQSPGDLLSQYGGLADEAKQLFEINRQIASIRAQGALDTAARGIAGELGVADVFGFDPEDIRDITATYDQLIAERERLSNAYQQSDEQLAESNRRISEIDEDLSGLRRVIRNVDDLADALGISEDAAREVVAQFAQIGQAQGADEQAQAMSDLAAFINEASNNLAEAEDEGKALYDQLLEAAIQALELSKVDVASNIAAGADAATVLKEELAAALALQNRINSQQGLVYSGRGGDPRRVGSDDYTNELGYRSPQDIIDEFNRRNSGRRRSGGSGRARVPEGLREAERLYDGTRTKAEEYAAEVERINELHRLFPEIVTTEVRDRALGSLEDGLGDLGVSLESVGSAFADTFADIITGAEDAGEALSNLLSSFANVFAQTAISSIVGSLIPSAKGNVFSGGSVVPFATGGVVNSPTFFPMRGSKTGLMGEAGPEAILPLTRINGKLGVMAQGGGGVTVRNEFNVFAQGAQIGVAEEVQLALDGRMSEIERRTVAAVASARKRGFAV